MSAIFRGLGDSNSPLLFVLVACIVNVIGDLVLVAGLHMDAAGAAIATVTAQALSVVFAVILLIKKDLPFKITKKDFRLNPQCKKFLKIGLPLALQEFLTQVSFLALCAFVNRLGLEASSGSKCADAVHGVFRFPECRGGQDKTCKTVHVYRNRRRTGCRLPGVPSCYV